MEGLNITDYSYSGLVDVIQGDTEIAGDVLFDLACQLQCINNEIDTLEKNLQSLKTTKADILQASKRVLKHIQKEAPLSVVREKSIIIINDSDMKFETNVI